MKKLILIALIAAAGFNAHASGKREALRGFLSALYTKANIYDSNEVHTLIAKSINRLDDVTFRMFSGNKMSTAFDEPIGADSRLTVRTYNRKSSAEVYRDEQEELLHLRVEMTELDYTFVDELRNVFDNISIENIPSLDGQSITTVVETRLTRGIMTEEQLSARINVISNTLAKLARVAHNKKVSKKLKFTTQEPQSVSVH